MIEGDLEPLSFDCFLAIPESIAWIGSISWPISSSFFWSLDTYQFFFSGGGCLGFLREEIIAGWSSLFRSTKLVALTIDSNCLTYSLTERLGTSNPCLRITLNLSLIASTMSYALFAIVDVVLPYSTLSSSGPNASSMVRLLVTMSI